ncbi:methylglyoxal synthase [Gammaproteobacteria bacterium]|nr:methylglyoxal synthase [Gammaproteobacteria bacterium]
MSIRLSIGLVAHDSKKDDLVAWVTKHREFFDHHELWATGTTGARIKEAQPSFDISLLKSGPLGGDQQLGAKICEQKLQVLFFFIDPMTPMPHDVDVKALIRLSTLYNIPMACNKGTADLIISALIMENEYKHY